MDFVRRVHKEEEIQGFVHVNPWLDTWNFVSSLRGFVRNKPEGKYMGRTLRELDELVSYFKEQGYRFPRPRYKQHAEGWVSCMDVPPVAVSCHLAWEVTGDPKYREYRDTLIRYGLKEPRAPTFVLRYPDGKSWLSEYSGVDSEGAPVPEAYVLNGFLIGFHSLKLLAHATEDQELEKLYLSSLAKYKELAEEYYYKNGQWSYYMLVPLTINQTNYVIFETVELDGLHALTGDPFFAEEAQRRRDFLKNILKAAFRLNERKEMEWGLLRAAAPHPYNIDTYPLEIRFYDGQSKVLSVGHSTGNTFSEAAFMSGIVPKSAVSFAVYGDPNKNGNYIFYYEDILPNREGLKAAEAGGISPLSEHEGIMKFSHAAKGTGDVGVADVLWNDEREARVTINFAHPLSVHLAKYWGIPLYSESDTLIHIVMADSKGGQASRYYIPIKEGDNFILLHYLGFTDLDKLDLHDITSIIVRLLKGENSKEQLTVRVKGFYDLKSSFEVAEFLRLYPYVNKE